MKCPIPTEALQDGKVPFQKKVCQERALQASRVKRDGTQGINTTTLFRLFAKHKPSFFEHYRRFSLTKQESSVVVLKRKPLAEKKGNGGGGIRTPVPRCFKTSVYMLSRLFGFRLTQRQTTGSQFGYFGAFSPKPARTTDSASLLFDALT